MLYFPSRDLTLSFFSLYNKIKILGLIEFNSEIELFNSPCVCRNVNQHSRCVPSNSAKPGEVTKYKLLQDTHLFSHACGYICTAYTHFITFWESCQEFLMHTHNLIRGLELKIHFIFFIFKQSNFVLHNGTSFTSNRQRKLIVLHVYK